MAQTTWENTRGSPDSISARNCGNFSGGFWVRQSQPQGEGKRNAFKEGSDINPETLFSLAKKGFLEGGINFFKSWDAKR